jgi:hypothetical protein
LATDIVQPGIATGNHVDFGAGALEDDDVLDGFAAAHGEGFVSDRLQRDGLATAELAVGGDQGNSAGVVDTVAQGLGGEAAENDGVDGADTGTGLHGARCLRRSSACR